MKLKSGSSSFKSKKYVEHFPCLLIEKNVNNIDIKSPEYQELEVKYREKESEVKEMESRMNVIEKRLDEIDDKPVTRESILERISEK